MLELHSRVAFVLPRSGQLSVQHVSGLGLGRRTIFWPPGPVPFRKDSLRSDSGMMRRGGSDFAARGGATWKGRRGRAVMRRRVYGSEARRAGIKGICMEVRGSGYRSLMPWVQSIGFIL